MWFYFTIFATIILITLWALQGIFFGSFYQGMRRAMIIKAGNELTHQFGKNNFYNSLQDYCFKNNLSVTIFDENINVKFSSDSFGRGFEKNGINPFFIQDLIDLKEKLKNSNGKVNYLTNIDRREMLVYGSILKNDSDNYYLYLNSPLPPIDSTIAVLRNQLIIITFILFVLSFLISFFLAQNLSKPIAKLTQSASKLAKGDRKVVFEKGSYSEINQLADTLNYATKEISRVDELQKELIANISHDLRTPLTIIKVYAEMIRDIDNKEKRGHQTNTIIKEVDRLTSLVNDILELSKIELNNLELNKTNFDISKKLGDIMNRFSGLKEKQDYKFNINIDNNIVTCADEKLIERVIYNLIGNAATYTGNDKLITVNLKKYEGYFRFEVTDTGKGIPKEQIENIWERYYKVKENHKRPVIGTGLGLSIVKNILMLHSSKFGVISTLNKGSTFWFELETVS